MVFTRTPQIQADGNLNIRNLLSFLEENGIQYICFGNKFN
jgi:hypothetical protein